MTLWCLICEEWVDLVDHVRLIHPDAVPELMPDGEHYVVIDETGEREER